MIRLSIIGSGNVAQHLIQAFSKSAEIELVQVFARKPNDLAHLFSNGKITDDLAALKLVDVTILAVTDDAIANISAELAFQNQLVAHTSGSFAMEALNDRNRKGVFYPLQTFSKLTEVDFKGIPICLEAESYNDLKLLERVAHSISDSVHNISSEQRKALHVAAVFVSNFTNHLYHIGNEICEENHLSFDILKPLIQETANKILSLPPAKVQTGPAVRKDTQTINAHLHFLTDENQKEIYKMLTKSIIDNGKKL